MKKLMYNLNEFVSFAALNPEIKMKEEVVENEQFLIFSYMIGNTELWKNHIARECRGITFNKKTGECVSLPFEKFFRLNELEETQENHFLDKPFEVFEKIDGSMVTPILINGNIYLKTKKSFYSDVAILANKLMPENVKKLSKWCLEELNSTPIFEFTSPDNQVVIDYGDTPKFNLLAIRNNATGLYWSYDTMIHVVKEDNIPITNKFTNFQSIQEIKSFLGISKGIEGFVLLFNNKKRIKIKSSWYDNLHKLRTELRERDIVEMILDETIDDCKALITEQGLELKTILNLEQEVSHSLGELKKEIESVVSECKHLTVKEFASFYNNTPLFPLLIAEFRGKDPDYVSFWKKNNLSKYSLKCIFSDF